MIGLVYRLKRALGRSSFARNVAVLAGGSAFGQALALAVSPVLTRLYTPEDFGVLATYAAALAVIAAVAALRYEFAIPLPTDQRQAANLTVLCLGLVGGVTALVTVGVWALGPALVQLVGAPALGPYLWLLPLGVLGTGAYATFNYWAIRQGTFNDIARTRLSQSVSQVGTQLGLGALVPGPVGLLVGQIVGQAAGSMRLARIAWRDSKAAFGEVSMRGIRRIAHRYRRFPLISSGSALLNTAGLQVPALLVIAFFGIEVGGWFALAQRVAGNPLNVIGTAVSQVYTNEAPRVLKEDPKDLLRLFLGTAKKLLVVGVVPVAVLAVSGPWLFGVVFGGEWVEAGLYARYLSLLFLARFIAVPLSQTLNILERQDLLLGWDTARLVVAVGALVVASAIGLTSLQAIGWYSVGMGVMYVALFALCFWATASARNHANQVVS